MVSISDRLSEKLNAARASRQKSEPYQPNWGLAACVFAVITVAIASALPPVPAPVRRAATPVVVAPAPAPVATPAPALALQPSIQQQMDEAIEKERILRAERIKEEMKKRLLLLVTE